MHAISRFWMYKRLNNCAAPMPDSDDVSVVEEEVFIYLRGMPRKLPLKLCVLYGRSCIEHTDGGPFMHALHCVCREIIAYLGCT